MGDPCAYREEKEMVAEDEGKNNQPAVGAEAQRSRRANKAADEEKKWQRRTRVEPSLSTANSYVMERQPGNSKVVGGGTVGAALRITSTAENVTGTLCIRCGTKNWMNVLLKLTVPCRGCPYGKVTWHDGFI